MVIDTSAIIAILLNEPDAVALVTAITGSPVRTIAAPSVVEASAVLYGRHGPAGEVALDALLQRLSIVTVAMGPEAAAYARDAYRRFGKGVRGTGALNFGDCLSYGVAMASRRPLLFKGNDFSATDVDVVPY